MEHYITEIKIEKLRHLENIFIELNPEKRQHLLITGKNGSGKTTLLLAIQNYLKLINEGILYKLHHDYKKLLTHMEKQLSEASSEREKYDIKTNYEWLFKELKKYKNGISIDFHGEEDVDIIYENGDFITAFYPANRTTKVERSSGVENIRLEKAYSIESAPGQLLHKYMVHLKTQQAYARTEKDYDTEKRIQEWFDRFEGALKILFDDKTIRLQYNYKGYDFVILENGREPFGLNTLSDGYSSVVNIVSDLILRMDKNWLLGEGLSNYNIEGVVLIDELETHLHIDLQKKIMPFLTQFFPRIQFIVTTHSPYILGSIENAKAFDLEKCIAIENINRYSAENIAEEYFDVDSYSDSIKEIAGRYLDLKEKQHLSDEERAERAELRLKLKDSKQSLAQEILNDELWMDGENY